MKKRFFALALTVVLLVCMFPIPAAAAQETITVYNWGQYISDGTDGSLDVIAAFEAATGIKVNYITFDTNESLYTRLKTGGTTYDVIIPSDYMVGKLIAEDMLEPIDFANIPNYANIDEEFKNQAYDPENRYSVPYTWGTVGIIYNTKYVPEVTGWDSLWNEAYKGKILMFDNSRDAFAIAESRLGYSLNTQDSEELKACADLLSQQKPLVQSYVMDQIFEKMTREEAWIAPYYAGDYLSMAEDNENLAFCFPKEGFNVFIDAMCIPKGCQNKAGAEAFINFMCDPEISGGNLDYLGYATPISDAKQYMDEAMSASEIAYPNAETLSSAESFNSLPITTVQEMNDLWLKVKTAGNNTTLYIVIAVVVAAAIVALIIILQMQKKKKIRRRGTH